MRRRAHYRLCRPGIPQATISALDCSLRAIECAVGLYPGIDFVVADAHNPPYPPQSFDGVISGNMWEHLPDPVRFLEAVRRVLKPRGFLVLSTPSRYRLFNLLRVIRGRPVALKSPNHVTEYTVGQVKEQLRFGGFEVQRVDGRITSSAFGGIREFVGFGLIAPWLRLWLKVTGSHHCLGDPAFFLARKVRD
jgi:SAM-dependent methyltransferase